MRSINRTPYISLTGLRIDIQFKFEKMSQCYCHSVTVGKSIVVVVVAALKKKERNDGDDHQ